MTLGYWKQLEETKETFKNGWLYTGNVGRVDEDSYTILLIARKIWS
ncbi:MAG: AMP-binding protein [Thermodesulfobacteriota bacterium]|nr:MAG: AMP-binding protein [Thermodesulfobacteriota bacterium]